MSPEQPINQRQSKPYPPFPQFYQPRRSRWWIPVLIVAVVLIIITIPFIFLSY